MSDEGMSDAALSGLRAIVAGNCHAIKLPRENIIALISRLDTAERERDAMLEALRPFAQIVPSSLYPADGSENEGYCVLLAPIHGNPVEYTGGDLARARAALTANHSAPVVEE